MPDPLARLDELERQVAALAASFQRVPSEGFGSSDSTGTTSIPMPVEPIWIRITQQPDATHAGYSWEQVVPIGQGAFDDPAIKLTGNNGSTAGDRFAVAYEENDSTSVAVDTVVQAWPGFFDPEEGQEYEFTVGGGGSTELCQVTGAFTTVATAIDVYPAVIKKLLNTAGTLTWTSGVAVWLVQRFNFPLTTGSCFHAKLSDIGDFTIAADTRRVYMTTELEWCSPP